MGPDGIFTLSQLLELLSSKVYQGMTTQEFVNMAIRSGYGPVNPSNVQGLWCNYAAETAFTSSSVTSSTATAAELASSAGSTAGASLSTTMQTAIANASGSASTVTVETVTRLPQAAEVVTATTEAGTTTTVATGAGSVLTMELPAVFTLVAPIIGIATGEALFNSHPEWWTELSMKLLPFCYGDTDTVETILGSDGQIHIGKDIIDAIREFALGKGWYEVGSEIYNGGDLPEGYIRRYTLHNKFYYGYGTTGSEFSGTRYNKYYEITSQESPVYLMKYCRSGKPVTSINIIMASEKPFLYRDNNYTEDGTLAYGFDYKSYDTTYNNKTFQAVSISGGPIYQCPLDNSAEVTDYKNTYYRLLYGTYAPSTNMPSGMTPNGDPNYKPQTKDFVAGYDENGNVVTKPYVPIYPNFDPNTGNSTSQDDAQKPIPDDDKTPWDKILELIDTFVNPEPSPEPNPDRDPSIVPTPTPTPTPDPSPQPQPQPQPAPIPPVPDDPDDNGTTPVVPPVVDANPSGLLTVYNPTSQQVNSFGKWLWTTWSGDLLDTISKMFNNPMEGVIGLHLLYATPNKGETKTIKCGYLDSDVPSITVPNRYSKIFCGSMIIPEKWGNYLDYAPYTQVYCYLPFIGIVELDAKDVVNAAIDIEYAIDSYSGSCIAKITTAKNGYEAVNYQFSGNCAVQIPITSGNYSSILTNSIGLIASGIATAATGGAAAPVLGGAVASTLNQKSTVAHSGGFGSTHGAMGSKIPYVIVKRPVQKVVPNYNTIYGYPAHKKLKLSSCSGYTKVKEVEVISTTATEDEKKLIETALKAGVYVS